MATPQKRLLRKIARKTGLKALSATLLSVDGRLVLGLFCMGSAALGLLVAELSPALKTTAAISELVGIGLILSSIFSLQVKLRRLARGTRDIEKGQAPRHGMMGEQGAFGDIARGLDTLYGRAIQADRYRVGLDVSKVMVIISTPRGHIIYANPALQTLFETHAERVSEQFPDIDPTNLIGTDINKLLKNLTKAEEGVGETGFLYSGDVNIGGRQLKVRADNITLQNGDSGGVVTQWQDVTTDFIIATEIDHVVEMMMIGELDIEIGTEGMSESHRKVGNGVNGLVSYVRGALDEINRVISAMARGDLDQKIDADYSGSFGEIVMNTNAMVDKLQEIVGNIRQSARSIDGTITTIRSGMDNLSERSASAAAALSQTTEATNQISAAAKSTAASAESAHTYAHAAARDVDAGTALAAETVATMAEIANSSKRVSDIVGVIDEIAFQTNLLALNAAVEAARAGESGRGFAVVAGEVRSLAQRASTSAAEIKGLVTASDQDVQRGVGQADRTGQALSDILGAIQNVTQRIDIITQAATGQNRDVSQVADALSGMDQTTRQNTDMAGEIAGAVRAIAGTSKDLQESIAFFSPSAAQSKIEGAGDDPFAGDPSMGMPPVAEDGFGDANGVDPAPDAATAEGASSGSDAGGPPEWTGSPLDDEFNAWAEEEGGPLHAAE